MFSMKCQYVMKWSERRHCMTNFNLNSNKYVNLIVIELIFRQGLRNKAQLLDILMHYNINNIII